MYHDFLRLVVEAEEVDKRAARQGAGINKRKRILPAVYGIRKTGGG